MKRVARRMLALRQMVERLDDAVTKLRTTAVDTREHFSGLFEELQEVHDQAQQLLQDMTSTETLTEEKTLSLLIKFDEDVIGEVLAVADEHILAQAIAHKLTHVQREKLGLALRRADAILHEKPNSEQALEEG